MSQPAATRLTHIHTTWDRRPMSKMKSLFALFIPIAETKLLMFIKKHKLHHHMDFWDDGFRLTIPLDNKAPQKALANLAAEMELGGLDKHYEFVAYVPTDTPDEFDRGVCIID
ncbi:hypothetical protein FPANT_10966 [Fusarium pseudoanthophilum]|uniref:Uncharacterized protein n=1 Tax=Fusarium pseudoanthophilum TaxID=48495 RepID=A0A8H5KPX6_9HYPO|nr:hypothetical protein FPANT_10966 [Fusarium pseudoanthophilum]